MRRLIAIIISLMVPAAAFAQTGGTPAPCVANGTAGCHIVLNSHASNPKYGNEAQFLRVANNATGVYHTSGVVHDGEILSLRVYIDNNTNPKRVSNSVADVTAAIQMGCTPSSATSETICATISSPDAVPQSLNASLVLTGAQPFTLAPIQNSANVRWAVRNDPTDRAESSAALLGAGINLTNVEAGYGNSIDIAQLFQVHMPAPVSTVSSQAGGTVAPSAPVTPATTPTQPTTQPATTTQSAAQPATVNVTQVQGQGQTQRQVPVDSFGQATTSAGGSGSSQPASSQPAASSSQPASTTQSQSQSPSQPAAPGANAVNDATSDDAAIQSAQGQTQTQDQSQSTVTALPDTGATSATSGTLGLTLLLLGFGAYYRSRQSLWRRLRARA